jgi:LPS-assembly lipoprotein
MRARLAPVLAFGLAMLACAPLAGCGFTPLYATPALTPARSSVDVVLPGTSREGFLLREELGRELIHNNDEPSHYRLTITNTSFRVPRGVRVNNVANRYELNMTATYTLADATTGKILHTGSASAEVSYDSADPPYAGVIANQDGEQRVAKETAIRIRLELARYFEREAVPTR